MLPPPPSTHTGPPGPSAQAALLAAGAAAHEVQRQAMAEMTARLNRSEQRAGRLEAELQQERRSGRGLALQCRQAAMQMQRLQVGGGCDGDVLWIQA